MSQLRCAECDSHNIMTVDRSLDNGEDQIQCLMCGAMSSVVVLTMGEVSVVRQVTEDLMNLEKACLDNAIRQLDLVEKLSLELKQEVEKLYEEFKGTDERVIAFCEKALRLIGE